MAARPHWLPVAGKTWSPAVTVCFDTETRQHASNGRVVLKLRCWDAIIRRRANGEGGAAVVQPAAGETAADLATVIEAAAGISGEAWCFAHNAGFDLTVTSLPMVLGERGWQPEFINLGDETCVFVLKRGGERVTITDTWSWLRCSLDAAARDVGMRKVPLPADGDPLAYWHARCAHDCRILDRLIVDMLGWWDREQLGRFAVTGSSCGWRSLRKRIPPQSVLVGADPPRTDLERQAVYGGRKEVYRVGRVRGHWIDDWDLNQAHLTAMCELPLPVQPVSLTAFGRAPDALDAPDGLGAVCKVRVRCTRPVLPVRVGGEVFWPVGEFVTIATTPELQVAARLGADIQPVHSQWYRLSGVLAPWAQWCRELQAQPDRAVPRVVKRVAKGWGRSVPGRFALRTSRLTGTREATRPGWFVETGNSLDTGAPLERITYNGVERTYLRDVDGRDISPVVLAFVEGYVRAAIARTLAALDPALVLQVNTDGWWQTRPPRSAESPALAVPAPFTASKRATTREVNIRGPNHIDTQTERRLSGIPQTATVNLDGSYAWQDWPGLRWQMQNSRPGEYVRPGRESMLQEHYCRRWVLATGETLPPACRIDRPGRTVLCPWYWTPGRTASMVLADWQVPALQQLRPPRS
jgi:hypothetical protein